MAESFKKIGGAVAAYFAVDKIIDFGKEVVDTAAEVAAETSAFEQIMGDYADEASAKVGKIADATGMVDTRLTPYMTSMTAKFKGLGYGVEDATGYASRGLNLAADASAFWDKSLDESVSHLNSFINGSYEGGEAIGLFANDTQLAMYAVKSGLIGSTKEWANLDEATKQATRLEYAENMMKASGATGQAAKEAGQYANVQANLTEKWRQFKAQIGEPILQNVVIPAMEKLNDVVDIAREKFETIKGVVSAVADYWKNTVKPAIDDVAGAFRDTLQPIKDLFEPLGGLKDNSFDAEDAINLLKDACDFLKDKLEILAEKVRNAKDDIEGIIQGFKDAKQWAEEHETAVSVLAIAFGTLTTAVAAYNAVQAIKRAGGLLYLIDLAKTAIGVGALTVAENAHTVATTIATAATSAFGAVLSFLTSPVTLVIAAIGALIAIGVVLYKNWDEISAKAVEIWGKIKDWFIEVWGKISDSASEIWGKIKEFFVGVWQGIKDAATTAWTAIKDFFVGLWQGISDTASTVWNAIKDFFVNAWTDLKDKFTKIWNAITDFLSKAWETIKNVVQVGIMFIASLLDAAFQIITLPFRFIWENCKEYIFAAWEWIKEKVTTAINAVKNVISTVMNTIKGVFNTVWNAIKNYVVDVWNDLVTKITTIINTIRNVITTVWNAIKNFFTPILEAIKTAVTNAFTAVKNKVVEIFNAVKAKVTEIWNSIKTAVTNAVNAVKEKVTTAFNAVKNKVTEIFNTVKSKVTSVWNSIKTAITNAVNSIKEKVTSVFNSVKDKISSIFNSVKEKISSTWNNIKTTITDKINSIKSTVTTKFNEIKTKIQEPIEKAKDKIKSIIDKIKGFFDNLKLKLPHIKMPHFSIKGSFSLDPPSVPKLNVEWYKKAMNAPMIMNDPTIFGYNPATGNMMGGGEAGSEVVSGTSTLMQMIRSAVSVENSALAYYLQKLIEMLAEFFPELIAAAGHDIVADDGTVLAYYAPKLDKKLGEIQKKKERGR